MSEAFPILYQVERNGWLTIPIQGGWRLSHPQTHAEIFMSITPRWLCLTTPLEEEYKNGPHPELADLAVHYRRLLEYNERMFMAKFALEGRSTLLMVEVGLKVASALLIGSALEALSHYGDGKLLEQYQQREQLVRVVKTDLPTARQASITPGLSHETITRYIRRLGANWGIKEEPRDLTWHLGYKGRLRVFDVYLTVTKMWLYFQVPILADRVAPVLTDGDLEVQALFLAYLLRLNATWFTAKIGIGDGDQVLLLVEVPLEGLDFPLLRLSMRTIGIYLDRYGQEIQIMALLQNDPRLRAMLHEANP